MVPAIFQFMPIGWLSVNGIAENVKSPSPFCLLSMRVLRWAVMLLGGSCFTLTLRSMSSL